MRRQADGPPRLVIGLPRFVGRARELSILRAALADNQPLVIIEGEAGIGKTRLLTELLSDKAFSEGSLLAMCPPLRHPQTLAPLVDAVRRCTQHPQALDLSEVAGSLRPLLPEWADALPPALPPADDPSAGRHRVFRALAELLERISTRLLVVEDVHWADEATLEFLLFLRAKPVQRIGIVITSRPEDQPEGSLLRRLSAHRSTGGHTRRIQLGPLDVAETSFLVSSMIKWQAVPPEFVEFLHQRTEGVPLAVEESVRLLADRAGASWLDSGRDLDKMAVPATIRDAVLERVERLPQPAREILRAAAVLDEPASEARLLAVAGSQGVPEAIASGLVAEQGAGLIGFRHVLASQAVHEAMPVRDRRLMHLRAGHALEEVPGTPPGQLARHFHEAGDQAKWLEYGERAADLAVATGNEVLADRILHELIVSGGLPGAVMARLTGKLSLAVEHTRGELVTALRAAIAVEGSAESEQAALRLQLARALENDADYEAARLELQRAIPGLPPGSVEAAWAMHKLARPRDRSAPAGEHLRWLQRSEAVPVAGTAVDRLRLRVDRVSSLFTLGEESGWTEAARILDSENSGQPSYLIGVLAANVADAGIQWGRYAEASRGLDAALRISDEHGYPVLRAVAQLSQVHLAWATGAWAGLAEQARRLASDDSLKAGGIPEALLIAGRLSAAIGEHRRARVELSRAVTMARQNGSIDYLMAPAAELAKLSLAEGDAATAILLTDEPMAVIEAKGIWLWAAEPAPVRVAALVAAGRIRDAESLVAGMKSGLRGRNIPAGSAAIAQCRAMLAEAIGEDAATAYEAAEHAWLALPRPYDALLARERRARCVIAAGDQDGGAALLGEVATDLFSLGAVGDGDRIVAELREHGIVVRRPGPGRPRYGDELSPRELEVVRLLAMGKTDREIADTLVLSPKTIASHLKSARRKLRAESRIALAVAAIDAGLVAGRPA